MLSLSRLSNRSSFASKIKKSEIIQRKLLNSSQYLQLCKSKDENPDQLIFDSLFSYEKQLKTLQGCLIIYESKINHFRKLNTLTEIKQFVKNLSIKTQPLTEEEQLVFKPIFKTQKRKQCQQLVQILQQKQQQQRKAQQQFLRSITQQYEEDKMKQMLGIINLQRILNRKLTKKYQEGFLSFSKKTSSQKPNQKMIKNILTSSFMMVSIKIKMEKQMAFKTLLKQFGMGSIVDQIDTSLKAKGKALMALKQYPRLNLKRALWRWHLSTTDQGEKLFKRASDKLVLYTNINKTSFFYRLYNQVRVKQIKVDPKVKRMTVMFYLYTKIFFERPMRTFFQKTKIFTADSGKQVQATENIVLSSQMRQKDVFKKWLNKAKQIKQQEKTKKLMMQNLAKRIVQVSKQKKKYLIEGWKRVTLEKIKQNKLKQFYLKKLLFTKTGRIAQAINNWKTLPEKINLEAFKRISRFEKGLINFAERTLKRALQSFKNEYEKGQAEKKRAVIQLINITQGGQKRYFNKWKTQVSQHLLYQRCQMLGKVFENTKNSLDRNFSHLYHFKQYNLRQVSILQRFFSNLNDSTDQRLIETFDRLKQHAKFNRVNKWFYKAAQVLALKSHITVHKSFLRLKHNAIGRFGSYDNDKIKQKLQKLCCNMKKHYELIVFKAFITIQKYIKSQQKNESLLTRNTNTSELTANNSILLKQQSIISSNYSGNNNDIHLSQKQQQLLLITNHRVSVNLCQNIFNQNIKKQLNNWRYNINPNKKFIDTNSVIIEQHPDIQSHIQQLKSTIYIVQKLSTKHLLNLSLGFRMILEQVIKSKSTQKEQYYQEEDQNLQQRLELVTKQNILMQKIQQYKKENEILLQQLQIKQSYLIESNKTVTILSLRINYMVMQKFITIVEKVIENNIQRSINQGFDHIIQMANFNFERDQSNNLLIVKQIGLQQY